MTLDAPPFRPLASTLATVGAICLVATLLAAPLAPYLWPAEVLNHFRPQALAGAVAVLMVALAARARLAAAIAAIALVFHAASVAPLYLHTPVAGVDRIKVISTNLCVLNRDHARFVSLVETERPDCVVVTELTDEWAADLGPLQRAFPTHLEVSNDWFFGIGMYFRGGQAGPVEVLRLGRRRIAVLRAPFTWGGREVAFWAVHTPPPVTSQEWRDRDDLLDDLAGRIVVDGRPAILAGDLNTTSWSPAFKRLVARTGLVDSRRGFGVQGSFPAALWPARVAIDHVLVTPGIQVVDRRLGPDVGSDHLPVVCVLARP